MPKSDPTLKADLHQIDCVQCVTTEELPPDFYHEPPEGYSYWVESFKRNILALFGYSIPIILIILMILFIRSGDSTTQKRENTMLQSTQRSVEMR